VRRSILFASAAAIALLAPGCGSRQDPLSGFTGRDRGVAQTIYDYNVAARAGDAKAVCEDLLARSAKAPLGRDCVPRMRAALRSIDVQGVDVVAVRYKGDAAIATVVTGAGRSPRSGALALVQEGGRWRIARVGPLPPIGADAGA
jgi:hypothetical protein